MRTRKGRPLKKDRASTNEARRLWDAEGMSRRTWCYRQAELASSKDFGPNVTGETRPNRFRPNLNAGLGAFLDKSGEARKGAFWMRTATPFLNEATQAGAREVSHLPSNSAVDVERDLR
jgi:hypothetical protein